MLKRTTLLLSLVLIMVLLALAACGGGAAKPAGGESQPAAVAGGNADNGKKLFNEPVIASAGSPGCVTCHSLEKGKTLIGPSMAGIATEAAADIKKADYKGTAKTVEEFLKESIVSPDVMVTQGFQPGIMPKTYTKLSAQEVNDLVAYLMTLK
jgi:nitric oxide reductase subunit C